MQTNGRLNEIEKKVAGDGVFSQKHILESFGLSAGNIPEHLLCIETVETLNGSLVQMDERQQIRAIKAMFAIMNRLEIDARPIFRFSDYEQQIVKILRECTKEIFDAIFIHLPDQFLIRILPNLLGLVCHADKQIRFKFHHRLQTFRPHEILTALEKVKDELDETGMLSLATLIAEKEFHLAIPLLEKLADSEDSDIRIVVAQCLALESNVKSLDLLRKLVNDEDAAVQESAYYAFTQNLDISQIDIFERGLQHEMASIKEICADALSQIAPDRFTAFLVELFTMHSNEDILFALMLAAEHPDEVIFEDVVNLATRESEEIRIQVARTLAGFTCEESCQCLQELFTDPESGVRLAAFESLLEIVPDYKDLPFRAALADQYHWIQITALEAAVAFNRVDLVGAIFPLLTSINKMVQSRAIDSLIRLKGLDILPEIQETLIVHGQDADALLEHIVEDKFTNFAY